MLGERGRGSLLLELLEETRMRPDQLALGGIFTTAPRKKRTAYIITLCKSSLKISKLLPVECSIFKISFEPCVFCCKVKLLDEGGW